MFLSSRRGDQAERIRREIICGNLAGVPWFDPAWNYRVPITVDNSVGGADLEWYPVAISLTAATWEFANALADGSDIRVTDSDGTTQIPYYILAYDNIAETGTVWVRVPYIAAGDTATIYFYYGNAAPAAFQIPPTGFFTRAAVSVDDGFAENMVYDSVTDKYYVVNTRANSLNIDLHRAAAPGGPWTDLGAILNVGAAGQWDDTAVYASHLINNGGTWYLFYSGSPDGTANSHSIGYATAANVTGPYSRYASNPVVTYSGIADWKRYRAAEPFVYYSGILSKWVMFYMGDAGDGAAEVETLGYATADAITGPWIDYASNPIMALSSAPNYDDGVMADPYAYELNGVAYIGYSCTPAINIAWAQIATLTTQDYVTFRRIGPTVGRAVNVNWDDTGPIRGAISLFGTTYYLPYTDYEAGVATKWAVATMSSQSTVKGYDPLCVLDYYDNFDVDIGLWANPTTRHEGTSSAAGGIETITVTIGANKMEMLQGRRRFGRGYLMEVYCRHTTADGGGTDACEVGFGDYLLTQVARIYDYDNAKFIKGTVSGAGNTASAMGQNISTNWVTHRIYWVSNAEIKYQNDNEAWESIITNIPTLPVEPVLFAFRGSQNGTLQVDWIIVRKYIGSDPTVTIGAEETP